jgi:hypothetical protein
MTTKTIPSKPPAKPPASKKKPLPPPIPATPAPKSSRIVKTFYVEDWKGDVEGEKIILHGKYGMGKTTLSAMAPTPVFIGLDDGGRKIKHPVTGEVLKCIPDIESYQDARDALHQVDLFNGYETIVIDTGTKLQHLGLLHMLATIRGPKECPKCTNIEQYGWHKGYRHLYDTMHHILGDLDPLVRRGKNIIIICQTIQTKISNPGGEDFLRDTPDLQTDAKNNIAADYMSWVDHTFMIDHVNVQAVEGKAVASGGRCIRVHPEIHFEAKSRTLGSELATVSFENKQDDSIWKFLFGGE